jgi:hypothetical protein
MNADEVKMVKRALRFNRRPVIRHVNHLPHLANLDLQLRRIGRNNQHVRVRLDQDARLALVGFAQGVARLHSLGHALFQVGRIANARAVRADAAKVRQPVRFCGIEAVDGLRQHQRQRVFACSRAARRESANAETAPRECSRGGA